MFVSRRNNILDFEMLVSLEDDPLNVNLKSYVDGYLKQFPTEDLKIQEDKMALVEALNQDIERLNRVGYSFKGQRYQQQIYANPTSWYDLVWDVEVLKKIIEKEEVMKPQSFSVTTLYEDHIPYKIIDENRLSYAFKNEEPIILVEFPMLIQQCLLVEGNHRIRSRYDRGVKEILGYLLHQDLHLQAMPLKFHQRLYQFHRRLFQQQIMIQ